MKKLLLFLTIAIGTLTAQADELAYPYLTFETFDGNVVSVSVESLNLTISDTTLTVGDKTFILSNLNKMYFSSTDETTGIGKVELDDWDDVTDIYDISGHQVSREQMKNGVYIVKSKSGTYKLIVK